MQDAGGGRSTTGGGGSMRDTVSASLSVHQSAKMMDAQRYFQKVVKMELQVLLDAGMDRETAVKQLLYRIVQSREEPDAMDVKRVMKQFQMQYDDAVRALIVKQEIGRLKRMGLDAFAAIEELTRKMQRIIVPTSETKASSMDVDEGHLLHYEHSTGADSTEAVSADHVIDQVEDTATGKETAKAAKPRISSPGSLCQGITNVSISTIQEEPSDTATASTLIASPRSPPARTTTPPMDATFVPTRKRKTSSFADGGGSSSASAEFDVDTLEHRAHKSRSSAKKQRLHVEVGDSFLTVLTRKCAIASSTAVVSPTATSPSSSSSSTHATAISSSAVSKNSHKRQRATATSEPTFSELMDASDAASIHVAKRKKGEI